MTSRDEQDLGDYFAKYVPEQFRRVHELFAKALGYYWLPCPLCGVTFGGHEWRRIDGKPASIPDPDGPPTNGIGICPPCTRAGRGVE